MLQISSPMLSTLTGEYQIAQTVLFALLAPYLDRAHETFAGHEQFSARDYNDLVRQEGLVSKGIMHIVLRNTGFKL